MDALNRRLQRLSKAVGALRFEAPVSHVYNPLSYAGKAHAEYVKRYAKPRVRALLVGMNPGPWGMVQSGIPFGDTSKVRDWLRISAEPVPPNRQHPKRPILGFECPRGEVSGQRLWGWAEARFETPRKFFRHFFVLNYCPLAFLAESGKNLTPDHLPQAEREPLVALCDAGLRDAVGLIEPSAVIGVGRFARKRIETACPDYGGIVGEILHPSPASPIANRGWAQRAEAQLEQLGLL